jgi:hypothetical protein
MTTTDKTIDKTFADDTFEDVKIDERPVDTSLLPVNTCRGCVEGQPNQEAHMNWGGCLSIYDEYTEEVEDNDDIGSYCSTTSYDSDDEKVTIGQPILENIPTLNMAESTILTRRAANSDNALHNHPNPYG